MVNADLLHVESDHVKEEWEKLRLLNAVQERALVLMFAAYRAGAPLDELPGPTPAEGADPLEWHDYWLVQGAMELAKGQLAVAEAVAKGA